MEVMNSSTVDCFLSVVVVVVGSLDCKSGDSRR